MEKIGKYDIEGEAGKAVMWIVVFDLDPHYGRVLATRTIRPGLRRMDEC